MRTRLDGDAPRHAGEAARIGADRSPAPERIDTPPVRAAAVLYSPRTERRNVLSGFANALRGRGWRVGGLLQDPVVDARGERIGLDAVAIDTGHRIAIARPTAADREAGTCSLDHSALAESSAALRRALANRVDLVVVEKFGEREQEGEGLAADILEVAAAGIPLLVAVPAGALDRWTEFMGGLADLLPSDADGLWRWWGPGPMVAELARGVADGPVKRVIIGRSWTFVEGVNGCGLAKTPPNDFPGCRPVAGCGEMAGGSHLELARRALSWNPVETAIGVAAINAHYNHYDLVGREENGLDVFATVDGPVAVVGRFPGLAERLREPRVIELAPRDGEYPAVAARRVIPACEAAVITSATLVNRTLESLIEQRGSARLGVVGPGTPLAPAMHAYGIEVLSGLVVEEPDRVAALVAEGAGVRAIKPFCRFLTLREGA